MSRLFSRRRFVQHAAAASALAIVPIGRLAAQVRFAEYPFKLGVASGDPSEDGFVLWTRLVPEPHEPEQLGQITFEVQWQVAEDPAFQRIVAQGTAPAPAHLAHSVHAEVSGLTAGREYFYRFRLGRYESPVGRALTAPAAADSPTALRYSICSCAQYEQGFFSAYRYMADDRPDLIVELGDYIYEVGYGEHRVRLVRQKNAFTLDDYRALYAEYKLDPDLQAAHAACPWLVTWDDHEVDNDYAGMIGENDACGGQAVRDAFPARRAAAFQAWYEHMPVRASRLRAAGGVQVYGTLDWGRLARFYTLDTRQYRSPLACALPATFANCDTRTGLRLRPGGAGGGRPIEINDPACRSEWQDPSRSMLGTEQERWLERALQDSRAEWNLIAQGTPFVGIAGQSPIGPTAFSDGWAGYPAARQRLLEALASHKTSNPVVLSGDLHAFYVNEVRNSRGSPVAVELITSSIANNNKDLSALLPQNPQILFHDGRHSGYVRCEVTRERLRADLVAIEDMRNPRTPRSVLATYEIPAGSPEPRRIDG
jgi:alkaline phosphatase D